MKIRAFIERGRELYVQCPGPHPGLIVSNRRVPLDVSKFDPEFDHTELRGRLRCTICGTQALARMENR
jgi:hypothetical protein